jgi:hypothetical protein
MERIGLQIISLKDSPFTGIVGNNLNNHSTRARPGGVPYRTIKITISFVLLLQQISKQAVENERIRLNASAHQNPSTSNPGVRVVNQKNYQCVNNKRNNPIVRIGNWYCKMMREV